LGQRQADLLARTAYTLDRQAGHIQHREDKSSAEDKASEAHTRRAGSPRCDRVRGTTIGAWLTISMVTIAETVAEYTVSLNLAPAQIVDVQPRTKTKRSSQVSLCPSNYRRQTS
jgi:hypothetical protein